MSLNRSARRWLFLLVGVALCLLFFAMLRGLRPKSLQRQLAAAGYPLDWKALNAWYPFVSESENAALDVVNIVGKVRDSASIRIGTRKLKPIRFGNIADPEQLEILQWLASNNEAAFGELHQALLKPKSRYPIDLTKGYNTLLPYLGPVKTAVQQMGAAACAAALNHDSELAALRLADALRLSRTLEAEPILISTTVRLACLKSAVDSLEAAHSIYPVAGGSLKSLQELLLASIHTNGMERAWAGELALGIGTFQGNLAGAGIPPLAVSTGHSLLMSAYSVSGLSSMDEGMFLKTISEMLDAAKKDYPERRVAMHGMDVRVMQELARFPPKIVSKMFLPVLMNSHHSDEVAVARLRTAAVAMAVERYRLDHGGGLPAGLSELVPQYIRELPKDPANGKPLQFLAKDRGYVVYSVGENGRDDLGIRRTLNFKEGDPDDLVFEVLR